MASDTNPPKKHGCLFYGCLALILAGLLAGVLGYLGFQYARNSWNKLVNEYTDSAPAQLEKAEISPAQLQALQQRLAAFKEALDNKKAAPELVLSESDLNALIADNKEFKDKLLVMLDGDRIKGQLSLPLQDIGPLKLRGRYLNATATFKVSLDHGVLIVALDEVQVKGKPLPAAMLAELKKQNLAQDILRDAETAEAIRNFDRIQIKDSAVILKNKAKEQ